MFHSRHLNSKINKLHERALQIVHKNPNLTFQQLLNLDKTHCMHHRNLQKLAVEMFKVSKKLVPATIQEPFHIYDNIYNLRGQRCWHSHNVRTVVFGTESFTYPGQKTWHLLLDSIRKSETLNEFKAKIKQHQLVAHADYAKHTDITSVLFNLYLSLSLSLSHTPSSANAFQTAPGERSNGSPLYRAQVEYTDGRNDIYRDDV